jgi:hypothetical protein
VAKKWTYRNKRKNKNIDGHRRVGKIATLITRDEVEENRCPILDKTNHASTVLNSHASYKNNALDFHIHHDAPVISDTTAGFEQKQLIKQREHRRRRLWRVMQAQRTKQKLQISEQGCIHQIS